MKIKSVNLEDDIAVWLETKTNASECVNKILRVEFEKENGLPPTPISPYPRYSPRNSCGYVEERLKQLRSTTKAHLADLMAAEVGLSNKKVAQYIAILLALNRIIITSNSGVEYLVSLWSKKENRYKELSELENVELSLEERELLGGACDGKV